jgi:hypothetical protein
VDNFGACGKVQYSGEWQRRENTRTWQDAHPHFSTGAAKFI